MIRRSSARGRPSYPAFGNDPAQTSTPPPVTIGSGWSPQAPGPYGSPRFPWTVGAAVTVNGADSPIFVDPAENVVTVQANSVEVIGSGGAVTTVTGATGQVYAGTVNGTVIAPAIAQQSYQNQPYYPFNLTNLDIGDARSRLRRPRLLPPPPPPPRTRPAGRDRGTRPAWWQGWPARIRSRFPGTPSAGADHYIGRAKHERRELGGRGSFGDDHVLC